MPAPASAWPRTRLAIASILAITAGTVTSCGRGSDDSDPATWVLRRGERVSADTTTFTATVTRVGCNSGVDGEPTPPDVEYTASEVTITFEISPHSDSGTCQGTTGVPYEVELEEPLGDRSLVDGQCHPGSDVWTTAFCSHEGVRYSPG